MNTKNMIVNNASPTGKFEYREDEKVSQLAGDFLDRQGVSPIYSSMVTRKILDYLRKEGLIKAAAQGSAPTEKGTSLGIYSKGFVSNETGETYTTNMFGERIQEILWDKIPEFVKSVDDEHGGQYHRTVDIYARGRFNGEDVAFKRKLDGHWFTDEEVEKLLRGETVTIRDPRCGICYESRLKKDVSLKGIPYFRVVPEWSERRKQK